MLYGNHDAPDGDPFDADPGEQLVWLDSLQAEADERFEACVESVASECGADPFA